MNSVKFNKGNVLMVAHRGLSGIEAENTPASFIAAANRSYYAIETDIHKTADGKFVTNHDGNLLRIAGEDITVADSTLDELQSVILYDKDGTKNRPDLRVATLENYISICKKYEKHCVLEIKPEFSLEDTEAYINIIKKLDYLDNVTFISFKYENLKRIRQILPNHPVQFLFSVLTDEIIESVIADRFDVDSKYTQLTKENIELFHKAGVKVNCWTVDDKDEAEKLASWGVDYISSNILE